VTYLITWKGCSEGHYKKFTEEVESLPKGVKTKEDLEEFLDFGLADDSKEPQRTWWLIKNMPHFINDYECGTNPTNFHVLLIQSKEGKKNEQNRTR
jgi:hypothetical protein